MEIPNFKCVGSGEERTEESRKFGAEDKGNEKRQYTGEDKGSRQYNL